ncbi:MAG: GtrA family protein [Bacteroidales bacterium]|nr:GtrA family protein [Bacteroidales bacterium]
MKIKEIISKHPRFVMYAIFGIISTALEFAVYALLCKCMPYLYANIIAFHCGIICSFILNRKFNFKKEDKTALRFAAFYLVQIVSLALSELILFLCVDIAGWNTILAKCISIIPTTFVPFLLNKHITFGKPLS